MSHNPFSDHRGSNLLQRVRQDISHLRNDISKLLSHSTHETIPNSARDLAEQAKNQLAAGGAYATSRLRDLRHNHPSASNVGLVGGVLLAGAIAYGVFAICRGCCGSSDCDNS